MSAVESIDNDVPEIRDGTYKKIDRWADALQRTPVIDKRTTFKAAAADLFADAQRETNLGAYQSIKDDIATLGEMYAGLDPEDVDYVMIGAEADAKTNGNGAHRTLDEPPPAESPNEFGIDAKFDRSTETRQQIAKVAAETTGRAVVAFPLVAFGNIKLDTQRRNYLIKNILPRRGLAVIWGAPKCYKSFIATDMALHIALNWYYRGYRVQQAAVVYIALEGREGQAARKEAFAKYHGVTDAPFYLITVPLDLVKQHRELILSIEKQLGDVKPGAVFIDTLNRSLVGSESKDEDMAEYLGAAGAIEQHFACLVPIVHHCGIDRERMRGHTSLPGAVDVQIRVDRIDNFQAVATVVSAKDFPEGTEIYYRLEAIEVGTDPDGDPITSLVVLSPEEAGTAPERRKATRGLGPVKKNGLNALTECLAQTGTDAPATFGLPAGIRVVSLEDWRLELFRRDIIEQGKGKNPASQWSRLKNKLFEKGHIGIRDEKVWRA